MSRILCALIKGTPGQRNRLKGSTRTQITSEIFSMIFKLIEMNYLEMNDQQKKEVNK